MPKKQEKERWNEMPLHFPGAGDLVHRQNLAIQNATRMTGQVCHQVMSMNRAWFELWSTLIMDFAALPRRFTSAQVDYAGNLLSSFEKTGRELGNLVLHAEEQADHSLQQTAEEAGRSLREWSEAPEQAASALQGRSNSRRQKNERGKRGGTESTDQEHAH